MIISPSLLAADFLNLQTEIAEFETATDLWLHLDVMDGHFVPNLTFGHDIIRSLRRATKLPLDAHFMVTNPEFYIETLKDVSLQNFTFHIEAHPSPLSLIQSAKRHFPSVGISIKPATPTCALSDEVLKVVDLVLVMSVEPGFGGQKFQPQAITKIKELRARRATLEATYMIQVDGGVNRDNAPVLIVAGAENLVAGSSVFKEGRGHYLEAVNSLRS